MSAVKLLCCQFFIAFLMLGAALVKAQPNDPEFFKQKHLESPNNIDIDALVAWELTKDKEKHEVIVAVIDSALDTRNADLSSRLWVNKGEIPGNGQDDDNNGYIDDYHGYDFRNDDGNIYDGIMNHATPIAGLIAAQTNNNKLVSGVAGDFPVKIMPLQIVNIGDVFFESSLIANGPHIARATLRAMEYAIDHGARIINMSLNLAKAPEIILMDTGVGAQELADRYYHAVTNYLTAKQTYSDLPLLEKQKIAPPKSPHRESLFYNLFARDNASSSETIKEMAEFLIFAYKDYYQIEKEYQRLAKKAMDHNVLVITAGVNFPVEDYPSLPYGSDDINNVIKVGSIDANGNRSSFSEYGETIAVYALGENVVSTRPGFVLPWFATNNGTSFATGIVSGVAAMAWSLNPDFSYQQIKNAIEKGVIKTDSLKVTLKNGKEFGAGMIKAPLVLELLGF